MRAKISNKLCSKNFKRIPWAIHINPRMIDTGLEAKIIPINLKTSSANLKIMYTNKAGIKKIARYIHVEEIPLTVSGKG